MRRALTATTIKIGNLKNGRGGRGLMMSISWDGKKWKWWGGREAQREKQNEGRLNQKDMKVNYYSRGGSPCKNSKSMKMRSVDSMGPHGMITTCTPAFSCPRIRPLSPTLSPPPHLPHPAYYQFFLCTPLFLSNELSFGFQSLYPENSLFQLFSLKIMVPIWIQKDNFLTRYTYTSKINASRDCPLDFYVAKMSPLNGGCTDHSSFSSNPPPFSCPSWNIFLQVL